MVESTEAAGDGIVRDTQYAKFREDKEASPGYSRELIANTVDVAHYDDLNQCPRPRKGVGETVLELFEANVADMPNEPYLGFRPKKADGTFAEYTWLTYSEVDKNAKNLARGLMLEALVPKGEDGFNFCGIWSKNRQEWLTTLLACMHYQITAVGFYDAMGTTSVDFILEQTEMKTIICSGEYIKRMVQMKADGLAQHITALVTLDEIDPALFEQAE